MKPFALLFLFLLALFRTGAQSLDYISVQKKNGRAVKNFFRGSNMLLQTNDGGYLQGPINAVQNDTVYLTVYDVRLYRTVLGSVLRDTITSTSVGVPYKSIRRIYLNKRRSFFQRSAGPLLMISGAGYFTLNVLNGALFDLPVTDQKNLKTLGIAAGAFGLGFLLNKLFATDGFSTKRTRIVYVDLSK